MRLGKADVVPGLALHRQSSRLDAAREVKSLFGVSQLDGYSNGVYRHVGRAELGTEIIAVAAQTIGDLLGTIKVPMCLQPVIVSRRSGREYQVERSAKREGLRQWLPGGSLVQAFDYRLGDRCRLTDLA